MAKKKPEDDRPEIKEEQDAQAAYEKKTAKDETPAELPDPEPAPEPDPVPAAAPETLTGTSPHKVETEKVYTVTPAPPEYGEGAFVAEEIKNYYLLINNKRYVHVGDMPDGRWIYRPD